MPKQTFVNLPEEKRKAFIEIALDEFADNDYNSASVSKIVEKAGIAKGSVYQYFADKKDLFMYLLDVCNQEMMGHIQQSLPRTPALVSLQLFAGKCLQRYRQPSNSPSIRSWLAAPIHLHCRSVTRSLKKRRRYARSISRQ